MRKKKKSLCKNCRSIRYENINLIRKCPKCESIINYKTKWGMDFANRKNSVCSKCRILWQGKSLDIIEFESNCKKCGETKYHKWKNQTINSIEKLKETANNRLCRKCAFKDRLVNIIKKRNTNLEIKLFNILKKLDLNFIPQYTIDYRNFDVYLVDKNILIETDGVYWHGKGLKDEQLNETQMRSRINDRLKDDIARKYNIKLIRIWEDELTEQKVKELLNI